MAPTITVRSATWTDWPAFQDAMSGGFGGEMTDDGRAMWEPFLEFDEGRMLVAVDEDHPSGQFVGTAGWLGWTMTVPGSELLTAAVTMVAVRTSHRRRGILRQLMQRQLEDARAQGYPLATLWASESAIYQRFGYGLAFLRNRISIDPRRAAFLQDTGPRGEARMLTVEEAQELLPPVYEQARMAHPGSFKRQPGWWEKRLLSDRPNARHGGGPMFRVAISLDGQIQGYAIYNIHGKWTPDGLPDSALDVAEAIGVTPAATREVWRYLFNVDLVAQVRTHRLCEGHPLTLALSDPRQLRVTAGDGTWVRLVEVGPALTGRRYLSEGALTFRLLDPTCSWNEGVWTLDAGPAGASLTRANASPELTLGAGELAGMYLGAVRATRLQQAGRVEEHTPGAAYRADLLFGWSGTPWCLDDF